MLIYSSSCFSDSWLWLDSWSTGFTHSQVDSVWGTQYFYRHQTIILWVRILAKVMQSKEHLCFLKNIVHTPQSWIWKWVLHTVRRGSVQRPRYGNTAGTLWVIEKKKNGARVWAREWVKEEEVKTTTAPPPPPHRLTPILGSRPTHARLIMCLLKLSAW